MNNLIRLRQELHRNPELSGSERGTGKRIRFFLNHYPPTQLITGIAGEGMAAIYSSGKPGPTLLFRCELDALPIHESINKPYASNRPGVSHACGHDGHIAMVSGLAEELTKNQIDRGRVILFYQPEAENGQGAYQCIKELVKHKIHPDFSYAIHNMPKYPLGSVILAKHTFASASKGLVFKLIGSDSHAAYPEKGKNPSLAISEIIQGFHKITESKDFLNFVMLTIIHIKVGEVAFGTSPGYGEIMITLRSHEDSDMKLLSERATLLVQSLAIKHELNIETLITDDFPAVTCDPKLTEEVNSISSKQKREVIYLEEPNRWSEDFSHFAIKGPSILFGLGTGEDMQDLHSPNFDFPDEAIEHGINIFNSIITKHLR
ncbi:MAG: amidohydrolase [Bacteroidales bacterium]